MQITLVKAGLKDAQRIHAMQIEAFMPLLEKYQDHDINPASEPVDKVVARISQPQTDYYLIRFSEETVGAIRIVRGEGRVCRVSPVFILPEYQGRGIAQKVFEMIECKYDAYLWELDTILQETGNCRLYEKLGYVKTGKTERISDRMTIVYYEKRIP